MKYIQSRLLASAIFILSMVLPGVVSAESEYKLTVLASPTIAGSFNKSSATLEAGKTIQLVAYANSNFDFVRWVDQTGALVSEQMDFTYTMPARDVQLTAEYEYNPANPANPVRNYWNKQTGEVIVDDFTTGQLQSAVKTAIDNGKASEVSMITVAGVMNTNDFGILNTYSSCTLLDLSRVAGVIQVPSYAFDNTNLEAVYLPATIESIGTQAFYGCKQLTSMVIYAITPPSLGSNVFTNVPDGLVVYVPASAISLYQDATGWKNFTILPIQEDIRSISVSLPDGTHLTDYTNMWLELTNTKSGQKLHYVMTDRQTYTFANIIRNTSWNVTLRNERGDIFGQIDNVEVKDEDVSVAFNSLSKPQSVVLSVLTPDGQDVTAQTQITWIDAQGNYLAQGVSLTGMPTGYQTTYRIVLSHELAMAYNTPQPVDYVLTNGNNKITCQLNAIPQVKISGKVKDASTGLPLSGAVISTSQTFGGKYSKTLNVKTDGNGMFSLNIANVPTSVAFAASDYVSQTVNCDSLLTGAGEIILPDVSLKTITGATITLGFTYTPCEGETQNWYSDYQNVSYELFNVTKNKAVSQYNVQYPQIVLLEEVADGDVLRLTATSRTNAFMPVTATATIAEQKAEATFAIVELGKIQSSFASTGNTAVVGSLYDAAGKLLKTYNYSEASLAISDLADGLYTLVSMGSSRLFNTIYVLSQLPQTGLIEGTDYVQNSVEVKSGQVSTVIISEIPTLDESKFYYTGDNTSFTVNKPSIVAGNYLTLTGRIDFKPAYATNVSNVQMIVDLPESCEFVENSVMVGNSTSSYTLNGNRITIPMVRYTDRVRFCIIPTLGGEYAPSAFAQFYLNGETVTQPIGSANYTAKDLSISVPSTVAKTSVPVSGTAIGTSNIEIYDNGVLIGQTTSITNGTWATTCELNEPYNLSKHQIYAKVTTKQGIELISEIVSCVYDMNAIQVSKVKMYHWNPEVNGWNGKNYELTFDFLNPSNEKQNYIYYIYNKKFTFTIDFTNNDTTKVSDVVLFVKTAKSGWHPHEATYDLNQGLWVAAGEFGNMYDGDLPVNVSVSYYVESQAVYDTLLVNNLQTEILKVLNDDTDDPILEKLETELDLALQNDSIDIEEVVRIYKKININKPRKNPEELSGDSKDFYDELNNTTGSISEIVNKYVEKINRALNESIGANIGMFDEISAPLPYGTTTFSSPKGDISVTVENNKGSDLLKSFSSFILDQSAIDEGKYIIENPDTRERIIIELPQSMDVNNGYSIEKNRTDINSLWNNVELGASILKDLGYLALTNNVDAMYSTFGNFLLKAQNASSIGVYNYNMNRAMELRPHIKALNKKRGNWKKGLTCFHYLTTGISTYNNIMNKYDIDNLWEEVIGDLYVYCDFNFAQELETIARKKKKDIWDKNNRKFWGDAGVAIVDAVALGASGITAGASLTLLTLSAGGHMGMQFYGNCINRDNKRNMYQFLKLARSKCSKFPKEWNDWIEYLGADLQVSIDPSGYVFEGVFSNRVYGATATIFYKEKVEDMYGDLHENIVKWNAEEYAQENPLFTDENGYYRWDVPQGLWQVKFEKEGYETTYSEWLPVPPPQLDVNIAMKQNRQPEVKAVRAYEDAVEVEFDKYMMPELLTTENIIVMQGDKPVEGTIEMLNEEASYENNDETFASKVRFNAAHPFTAQEVTLMVSNRVKSYAGIRMQDDFTQTFKVEQEIKQILCDSLTVVDYGGKSTLTVAVLPASASKDKTLTVKTSSPMILGVETEQVIIGEDGTAEIIVSGELPGTAALTFSVEGTDKTALTIANVEQKVYTFVAKPIANIASGSVVDTGTQIILSCETDGVTIYYTIDGSCPCDNASRIKYDGTPIIINEGVTIKVIAVAPNGIESEVAEFVYTTKDEEDAIIQVPTTTTSTKDTYDISGRKVGRKAKGIIIRNNNGTNRKVLVK